MERPWIWTQGSRRHNRPGQMGNRSLFEQMGLTYKQANGNTKARPARTCSGGPDIDRHMC